LTKKLLFFDSKLTF